MNIEYRVGDLFDHDDGKPYMIGHVCNNMGVWGAGFVVALSERYTTPERAYRGMAEHMMAWGNEEIPLGTVQFVKANGLASIGQTVWVANMVAQDNMRKPAVGSARVRYDYLYYTLDEMARRAVELEIDQLVFPRIGCGIGGGDWGTVEHIIDQALSSYPVAAVVYGLPEGEKPSLEEITEYSDMIMVND